MKKFLELRAPAFLIFMAFLVAAAAPLSGCGQAGAGAANVILKTWAPANQIEKGTMEKMCAMFQAAHPQWNIRFVNEIVGEDNALTEVLKDVTEAADVFFFANDQIEDLRHSGAIARLGGPTEEMVHATMPDTVVDTVVVDGKTYGIPFTHNTFFMYYDKTLLDEGDIGSLDAIMAKPTAANVYNFMFNPAGGWMGGAFYYGAGLTIYGEDQVSYEEGCNWNSETGVAVTKYLIDLLQNSKCVHADDASPNELARENRLGAWFDGAWNYDLYKDVLGDDLGLAPLPTFSPDGNTYQLRGFYGSKAIGVNAQTRFMEQAVAFAAFLGSEAMQVLRFEESAQVPTNREAGKTEAVLSDEVAVVIMQEAEIASVMQPTNANFGANYWANAGALFTEIKNGSTNHDNVREKLETFANAFVVD
ncbi:MAG: extracellular solute-binding protein [Oscillospiraceae bacterium]|nr:extracellular solute-binding protein [Oscillospiraceae bacterium]